MSTVHFEIGMNIAEGTMSIFSSLSLRECLKEWKERGLVEKLYFIDVWETDENNTPIPLANIKIENWMFDWMEKL